VLRGEHYLGKGTGKSKQAAAQEAARIALGIVIEKNDQG